MTQEILKFPDLIIEGKKYVKTPSPNYYADEIELSYLAGIIDGEGTILIVKQSQSTKKNPSFCLALSFCSTDKCLCDWVRDRFGGSIVHSRQKNDKWKDAYRWQIRSNNALKILLDILPFLIIKKIQADYAICFQKERRKPGIKGITQEEIKKYEWYKKRISEGR